MKVLLPDDLFQSSKGLDLFTALFGREPFITLRPLYVCCLYRRSLSRCGTVRHGARCCWFASLRLSRSRPWPITLCTCQSALHSASPRPGADERAHRAWASLTMQFAWHGNSSVRSPCSTSSLPTKRMHWKSTKPCWMIQGASRQTCLGKSQPKEAAVVRQRSGLMRSWHFYAAGLASSSFDVRE